MKIDVRHIAALAKLRLPEDKVEQFERQMQDILNMVENLPPIEDGLIEIDPGNTMALRPDTPGKSLGRDEFLALAPQKQAGCIVVPKTVG